MKKLLVTMLSLISISTAYAGDFFGSTHLVGSDIGQANIYGPADLEQVKASSLAIHGPLRFKNLEVAQTTHIMGPVLNSQDGKFGTLTIAGPFEAAQVVCQGLNVTGPVDVKSLSVQGTTEIIGPLKAEDSHLQNLIIRSDEVTLVNSVVNNILVKATNNKEQTIYLQRQSVVEGNINFESGRGVVEVKDKSVIHGTVTGGKIARK